MSIAIVNTSKEHAHSYAAAELSPIPVKTDGSKSPKGTWKLSQKTILTDAQIEQKFRGDVGVGIVCGGVSGGLEVIDFDEAGLYEMFADELERTSPGLIKGFPHVKSPHGDHIYVRSSHCEGNQILAKKHDDAGKEVKIIETRGEGGQILAPGCPPSCHPSGKTYEHVAGPPIEETPTITANERAIIFKVARSFNQIDDEPKPVKSPGFKGRNGNKIAQADEVVNISARAEKYLSKMRPAISGQGGHDTTYHTACVIVQGYDLTPDEAYPVFSQWNQTCKPPWSPSELRHKLKEAEKALGERGYLLNGKQSGATQSNYPKLTNRARMIDLENVSISSAQGRTETANAQRLVAKYGDIIRRCEPWKKWLVWDGSRWALDDTLQAETLTKRITSDLWDEATQVAKLSENKDAIKQLLTFCKSSNRDSSIKSILSLARSEPGIQIEASKLDVNPWLLNVMNGTIDLKTGKLRPHCKDDYLTKMAGVVYDATADCPIWYSFLDRIFEFNRALIRYIRQLIGILLTGDTSEHILPYLFGLGANGKSTLIKVIMTLLGEYSMKAASDLLIDKNGAHPTEIADLFGKRFVACVEAGHGRKLAEALVKELTGGDTIRARRMREDFWEFEPKHKVWIAANTKLNIQGDDHGIWRRVKLIPFNVIIPDNEQDKQLDEKLKSELSGILNWALMGCLEWQAEGLIEPPEVTAATAQYRNEMDTIGTFVADCCLVATNAKVGVGELYDAYQRWCETNKERPFSKREFGKRMDRRGLKTEKGTGGRRIKRGIGLLEKKE